MVAKILVYIVHQAQLALERERIAQAAQTQLLADLQREVGERIKAEQSLRASQQQLAQFLEAVPAAIFVVDAQGQSYYANQASLNILGKDTISQIDLSQWSEVYQVYQVETGKLYTAEQLPITRALRGERITVSDLEIRRDGQVIPLEISARPILDEQGEIMYAIATFQDITQRQHIERERIRFAQVEALLQKDKQKLLQLVTFDSLTQVANRRKFDEYLGQEWQRLAREQTSLALIMVDVDYFKPYNDYYGHQAGDNCLKQIAVAIQQAIKRPADLVTRYGGEEFAVILPNTDIAGATKVAEEIQANVHTLKLNHQESKVSQYVTLSLGAASLVPVLSKSPSNLVMAADLALYKAKKLGRDRICTTS